MSDSLTPAELVEIALNLGTAGFDHEFDVPELWKALAGYPAEDHVVLADHLRFLQPPPDAEGHVHARAREILAMVLRLVEFHAGLLDGAGLLAKAEAVLVRNSQAPIAAGYHFHVRHLLDPHNPIFKLEDFVCPQPFQQLDVLERSAHLCCASWLHKSAGNLATTSHEEVWNSDEAAAIRQSVLDGSYRYCNKNACPIIPGGNLSRKSKLAADPWWAKVMSEATGKIDRRPRLVNLAYDRHCNLSCPSCRTELITTNEAGRRRLDRLTENNIYPLLSTAEEAFITGSGDPFASRTFRKLLGWISDETCPRLEIVLMTNGMLFTEDEWAKFPNLRGKVKMVKVSMDGARKESHELLRRRSKWEVMMQNLPFIGRLLAAGEIKGFSLVFVVQEENFVEMGEFVDLARQVGAGQVFFERLTNWGTFSAAEYERKAVFNRSHPRHAEFLAAMADPRLRDPIVFAASLDEFRPREAREAA